MSQENPELSGDRHCGSCTACCVHLPLPEGAAGTHCKPPGEPCRHVGALGCRRYERRPAFCAALSCQWLDQSSWPTAWRPDRSGLVCLCEQRESGLWATIYEWQPGALTGPVGAEILAELSKSAAGMTTIAVYEGIVRPTALWQIEPLPQAQRRAS